MHQKCGRRSLIRFRVLARSPSSLGMGVRARGILVFHVGLEGQPDHRSEGGPAAKAAPQQAS